MGIAHLVVYMTVGAYEIGQKWYNKTLTTGTADASADALTGYLAQLQHDSVLWTRWEMFSTAGVKVAEGTTNSPGTVASGTRLQLNFCAFVRLNSGGPKRPSSKYIHGISEASVETDAAGATWLLALGSLEDHVTTEGYCDSDGVDISSLTFRKWSWRRKLGTLV